MTLFRVLKPHVILDEAQQKVALALDALSERLIQEEKSRLSWLRTIWAGKNKSDFVQHNHGLYIYGGVGRGKTMLMDHFFAHIPLEKKRRVHFHEFMVEVHERLHILRHTKPRPLDPVGRLVEEIAGQAHLLCFDEFHVTNIADAMILGRLFPALWARGVVIVATSNWAPDDLYKNGLQRDRFLAFIAVLKNEMEIVELDSGCDYRMQNLEESDFYLSPCDSGAESHLENIFAALSGNRNAEPITIEVQGRALSFKRAFRHILVTDFAEVCSRPLGAGDYLAIARKFSLVLLKGVPRLGEEKRDETKRFMTFIDVLYEARRQIIICADCEPASLLMDDFYKLEFQRTVSRLHEMRSIAYRSVDRLSVHVL